MARLLQRLVEKLRRKRRHGRERPLAKAIRLGVTWADQLSLLLAAVGLMGLLLLPVQDRWVKFDEKALMVNSVRATFSDFASSITHGTALAEEVLALQHADKPNITLTHLLQQHMQRVGLDAQLTSTCPGINTTQADSKGSWGSGVKQHSQNSNREWECVSVHGILKAPQTDGSEALLVVTPAALTRGQINGLSPYWDAPAAGAPLLLGSMLSLMYHLRNNVAWLSRDIVWVVPDARCGATASLAQWAQTYHGTLQGEGQSRVLHGGTLQQALVLQADRVDISTADVLVMGFDGLLPKLDTYNVLKELLWLFQDVRLQDLPSSPAAAAMEQLLVRHKLGSAALLRHVRKLGHMMDFMWQQLLGLPSGPHAALKTFMIDAATARFTGQSPPPPDPQPGTKPPALPAAFVRRASQMAQYAELVLHAFNNLDERFHHSFFLYLLTDRTRFVAVEMYIIPLVALIAALLLKAAKQRDKLRKEPTSAKAHKVSSHGQQEAVASETGQERASKVATGQATAEPDHTNQSTAQPPENTVTGVEQHASGTADDVANGIWGPAALVATLPLASSLLFGSMLRQTWCSGCRLCTDSIPTACCSMPGDKGAATHDQQCAALGLGQCPAAGNMAVASWPPSWMAATSTMQPGGREFLLLVASCVVVAITLGWETCLLLRAGQDAASAGNVSTDAGELEKGRPLRAAALQAAVRVVMLSGTAIMLAGMASMNWALAYGVAASLTVLVLSKSGCTRSLGVANRQQSRSGLLRQALSSMACVLAVVLSSPLAHVLLLATSQPRVLNKLIDGTIIQGRLQALYTICQDAVCCSRINTFLFWFTAYLPCWMFEVWGLLHPA